MSSYLDHLITRTLDLEPTVKPRLRSAFEPAPGSAPDPSVDATSAASQAIDSQKPGPPNTPQTEGEEFILDEAKELPLLPLLSKHGGLSRPDPDHTTAMSGRNMPVDDESHEELPLRTMEQKSGQTREPLSPHPQTIAPVANQAPPDAFSPRANVPRIVKSAGNVVRERPSGNTTQPPHEEATPIVRVTIGRVDVRANFTSAPAPEQRQTDKRSQRLSLVDYLKARNGGER
jgi:hypothetical protein